MEYEKLNGDKRLVLVWKKKRKKETSVVFPFALMDTLTLSPSKPFSYVPPSVHIPTALSLSLSDRWVGNEFRLSPSNRLGTKNYPPRQKCPFNLAKHWVQGYYCLGAHTHTHTHTHTPPMTPGWVGMKPSMSHVLAIKEPGFPLTQSTQLPSPSGAQGSFLCMFKRPGLAFKVTMAAIFRTRPLWGCPRNPFWPPWWNHTWPGELLKAARNSVWKSEQELVYVYICSDPTKGLADHPHSSGGTTSKHSPK